jgi:hypothetical protein
MIGGLKTIQVKVGHEREFEALFARLREEVRVHPRVNTADRVRRRLRPGGETCRPT